MRAKKKNGGPFCVINDACENPERGREDSEKGSRETKTGAQAKDLGTHALRNGRGVAREGGASRGTRAPQTAARHPLL